MAIMNCSTDLTVQRDKQHLVGYVGSKRNDRGEAVDLFRGALGELREIIYHRDGGMSIEGRYFSAHLDLDGALDRMIALSRVAA